MFIHQLPPTWKKCVEEMQWFRIRLSKNWPFSNETGFQGTWQFCYQRLHKDVNHLGNRLIMPLLVPIEGYEAGVLQSLHTVLADEHSCSLTLRRSCRQDELQDIGQPTRVTVKKEWWCKKMSVPYCAYYTKQFMSLRWLGYIHIFLFFTSSLSFSCFLCPICKDAVRLQA